MFDEEATKWNSLWKWNLLLVKTLLSVHCLLLLGLADVRCSVIWQSYMISHSICWTDFITSKVFLLNGILPFNLLYGGCVREGSRIGAGYFLETVNLGLRVLFTWTLPLLSSNLRKSTEHKNWGFPSSKYFKERFSFLRSAQKRIQNPFKHLRWSHGAMEPWLWKPLDGTKYSRMD